jgi:hypothetical protein
MKPEAMAAIHRRPPGSTRRLALGADSGPFERLARPRSLGLVFTDEPWAKTNAARS